MCSSTSGDAVCFSDIFDAIVGVVVCDDFGTCHPLRSVEAGLFEGFAMMLRVEVMGDEDAQRDDEEVEYKRRAQNERRRGRVRCLVSNTSE